ncbi:hypothetical protein DET49_1403 [Salegentibacter sp. 24]|uniref:hypothetical protein n=1 Tax=Salegentibacter sp. 24 TaxID=2183986 RepID=UPI00105EAD1F|nr:hypothetical protein [Salegentibacter sp. 24]TDN79068.1 hypothetical protein DET49_1403 [Salegentibacter sp. 24]
MKYKILILLLFLNLMWAPLYSNENCINDLSNTENERKESDLIFLGKIVNFEETEKRYNFEIIEVYKGFHPLNEIQIDFLDYDGKKTALFDKKNGFWIMYANRTGINSATAKLCGASRTFQNRTYLNRLKPRPEFFESKKDSLEYFFQIEKLINKNQQKWTNEILELKENQKNWNAFVIFALLLLVVLTFILIKNKRKKPVANPIKKMLP